MEWKLINEFNSIYYVNDCGQVKSIARTVKNRYSTKNVPERVLKPISDAHGYLYYNLFDPILNLREKHYAHRLVAEYFIPRVEGKLYVNHIDESKTNNKVTNLEWVTHKENMNHGTRNRRISDIQVKNPVVVTNLQDEWVGDYESINECCRQLNLDAGNVSRVLKGTYKQTKGYKLKYIN